MRENIAEKKKIFVSLNAEVGPFTTAESKHPDEEMSIANRLKFSYSQLSEANWTWQNQGGGVIVYVPMKSVFSK